MVSRSALPALLPDQCVTPAQCSSTHPFYPRTHMHTTHLNNRWYLTRKHQWHLDPVFAWEKKPQKAQGQARHYHQQRMCQLSASYETLPPNKGFCFSGTIRCCSYVWNMCWRVPCICFIMTPGYADNKESVMTPLSTAWDHMLARTHCCTGCVY